MQTIICLFIAYACGSIPFGKLIGNAVHINIQKEGSGNIGFANAVRILGWPLGILVLVGDVTKGALAVLFAKLVFNLALPELQLVALAAILGHIYPVWLKFHGGKGVATGFGTLLIINIQIALAGLIIYLLCFAIIKKSGMASVLSTWSLPLFASIIDDSLLPFCLLLAIIATYTHMPNIKELYNARTHKA